VTQAKPVNLVRVSSLSAGTGTFQLGPALAAFQGVEALVDGETYSYSCQQNSNFEYGRGVFNAAGGTLTRGVLASSYGATPVDFGPNLVVVFPALAEDLQVPGPQGVPGTSGPPGVPGPAGAGINMPVVANTGDLTPAIGDANKYHRFTVAAVVTVPTNAVAAIAVGDVLAVEQAGVGAVTFAAGVGATLNSRGGATMTAGQFAVAQLKKVAADEWTLLGDVA